MNFDGIIIGVATFLIIGVCHPLVIKAEYYFGVKSAWAFLAIGILFLALSLMNASAYSKAGSRKIPNALMIMLVDSE